LLAARQQLQINQARGAELERLRNWWQKDPKPAWWPSAKQARTPDGSGFRPQLLRDIPQVGEGVKDSL